MPLFFLTYLAWWTRSGVFWWLWRGWVDPCRTASLITVVIVTIWAASVVTWRPSFTHCNGNQRVGFYLHKSFAERTPGLLNVRLWAWWGREFKIQDSNYLALRLYCWMLFFSQGIRVKKQYILSHFVPKQTARIDTNYFLDLSILPLQINNFSQILHWTLE